jgi:stress-induced morphogen
MTGVAESMRRKLTEALAPTQLAIVDESQRHAGHAGARPEGETHFRIEIVSASWKTSRASSANAWCTGCWRPNSPAPSTR